jgi:hypothetical protein
LLQIVLIQGRAMTVERASGSTSVMASEAIQGSKQELDCFVAEPVIGRAFARPGGCSQ